MQESIFTALDIELLAEKLEPQIPFFCEVVGARDLNPRPTPKRFGAALTAESFATLFEQVERQSGIFLLFELALQ
jgi:hypothetical protein